VGEAGAGPADEDGAVGAGVADALELGPGVLAGWFEGGWLDWAEPQAAISDAAARAPASHAARRAVRTDMRADVDMRYFSFAEW